MINYFHAELLSSDAVVSAVDRSSDEGKTFLHYEEKLQLFNDELESE